MFKRKKYKEHTYPSGNRYAGEWVGNKREGKGTYVWTDGTRYEGDWKNNMQHGEGVMNFPNGNFYEGQFHRNNIHGSGTLRTKNGEVISGMWHFQGRADHVPNAHYEPVSKYMINVHIYDEKTGRSQDYNGQASLHLQSGLLVLPGMQDPSLPVMPFAIAVLAEQGRELLNEGTKDMNTAVAVAQPVATSNSYVQGYAAPPPPPQQQQQYPVQATPIAMHASPYGNNPQSRQNPESVAYGYHDHALEPQPKKQATPFTVRQLLDPRTYL